jgi:hypothetical protein
MKMVPPKTKRLFEKSAEHRLGEISERVFNSTFAKTVCMFTLTGGQNSASCRVFQVNDQ